jgi:hypothetical protein
VHRQLDDLPRSRVEDIGLVVVHQRRVVGEAVVRDDLRRPPARLPARAAESLDLGAARPQRRERALEVGTLLVLGLREGREVRVRVVPDLVPCREDRLDRRRIAIRRPAGDEERRRKRELPEKLEDPRHADERAVRLVRHDACVPGVEAAFGQDRRLGVDVEGQARVDHGAPPTARSESRS